MDSLRLKIASFAFAVALIYSYVFYYLYGLRACSCSLGWMRYFLMCNAAALTLLAVCFFAAPTMIPTWVFALAGLLNLASIAVTFAYVRRLKTAECDCSSKDARLFLEYFNYAQIALLSVGLIARLAKK